MEKNPLHVSPTEQPISAISSIMKRGHAVFCCYCCDVRSAVFILYKMNYILFIINVLSLGLIPVLILATIKLSKQNDDDLNEQNNTIMVKKLKDIPYGFPLITRAINSIDLINLIVWIINFVSLFFIQPAMITAIREFSKDNDDNFKEQNIKMIKDLKDVPRKNVSNEWNGILFNFFGFIGTTQYYEDGAMGSYIYHMFLILINITNSYYFGTAVITALFMHPHITFIQEMRIAGIVTKEKLSN